jgi:hypothetical protein
METSSRWSGSDPDVCEAAIKYRAAGKQTQFLERIEDYWKDTLVQYITPGAIHDAALALYPKATAATRNRQAIVPMQAVINHAADSELCARIRVKRFKVETKSKLPATLEWIEAFRKACKRPQLGALALFMFLTGARVSEALAVEWHDVDFKSKTSRPPCSSAALTCYRRQARRMEECSARLRDLRACERRHVADRSDFWHGFDTADKAECKKAI